MKSILRLRHWQVFIILMLGLAISNLSHDSDPSLAPLLSVTGGTLYFLWPLVTAIGLYELLPTGVSLNFKLFIFNSFVWLAAHIVIIFISRDGTVTFNNTDLLPWLYVPYAFFHFLAFPARTLKSIEKGRKASFGEYILDFFLIVLLPLGIWVLQPRINKVAGIPWKNSSE